MPQLTRKQIERQDFVDNQIFELMQKLLPPSEQMEWNIETIGAIRDSISEQIIDKRFMSEARFYPYLKAQTLRGPDSMRLSLIESMILGAKPKNTADF